MDIAKQQSEFRTGIYNYYAIPKAAEKREPEAAPEEGIYSYYAPKAAVKKREEVSISPEVPFVL
jgi:hypothetical protein